MTNIIPYAPAPVANPSNWRGVVPTDFDSAIRMAKAIAASGLAPKSYYGNGMDPAAAVFVSMQLGAEVGLSPMASVQNIAPINGRPGVWGMAQLAIVRASGLLTEIEEGVAGEGDARHGWCVVTRKGEKPKRAEFSVADAKKAKLWSKAGPWQDYPDRMLLARARTFALRDTFPDVLLGLSYSIEELQDIPPDTASSNSVPASSRTPEDASEKRKSSPSKYTEVKLPGERTERVPRTPDGAAKALDLIEAHLPGSVVLNNDLLDRIAEHLPELAERVTALRGRATELLAPQDDVITDMGGMALDPDDDEIDPETGEVLDDVARKMAARRGAPIDADT